MELESEAASSLRLLSLPRELILSLPDFLASKRDINALSQTCHLLHNIFDPCLWRHNENDALIWAAEHGNQATARKAPHKGADINVPVPPTDKILIEYNWTNLETTHKIYSQTGFTPLGLAISAGKEGMVRFLLQVDGIDVNNQSNSERFSPLTLAILSGNEEIVKILLAVKDVDVEIRARNGLTPLMTVSLLGLVDMARLLLTHAAVDPDKGNACAQSPIWLAIYRGHAEVVAPLIQAGASPHPLDGDINGPYGWYADPVGGAACRNQVETMRELIKSPRFDAKRPEVEKAQFESIRQNWVEMWRLLFAVGCANPNWNSDDGRTALWWAAAYGHEDVVRSLLSVDGVDVNTTGRGDTFTEEYIRRMRKIGPPPDTARGSHR